MIDVSAPPAPLKTSDALFLDLDGTLAPFAGSPGEVRLSVDQIALLRRLSRRLGGRLAIVTGRALTDLDRILGGALFPAAGVHGLERRRVDGVVLRDDASPALDKARAPLAAFTEAHPGVLLEDKGLSLALHFRQAPAARDAGLALATKLARSLGLAPQLGELVAELRTPGADKGDAVRAFMAEPPFAGARPIYVGDDLTDEDGFTAVIALGGEAVLVGSARATAANRRLDGVAAVYAWLEASMTGSLAA